jgi:hypothetical protein
MIKAIPRLSIIRVSGLVLIVIFSKKILQRVLSFLSMILKSSVFGLDLLLLSRSSS